MFHHPFRKALGLIALYAVIIIGVFVLQFRNESVISKNTGLLSISLAQTQDSDGKYSFKNSVQINFKGISFTADDITPASLYIQGKSKPVPLSFLSYEQKDSLSYTLNFTNDVSLLFSISDTSSSASLSISAKLPENAENVSLNYKPSSGFSVTDRTRTKLMLNSKNLAYSFTAAKINDEEIILSKSNSSAYYAIYDPTVVFTFASLEPDTTITQRTTYEANVKNFRANTVSVIQSAIQTSQNVTEKDIIAYVAELASQGKYTQAIESVPDSFKKGNKRTYLSSPYFNTLEAMYSSLKMYNENMASMIANAVSSNSLNVFTVSNLADYINILPANSNAKKLLSLPEPLISEGKVTLPQAIGILRTYLRLAELHSSLADSLLVAADGCISVIESCCSLSDSSLIIVDKDIPVSSQLALEAGTALLQWGDFNSSEPHRIAGYAIINTILSSTSVDSNFVGDAYPVLVNNPNYPHYTVLHRSETNTIWTWTCATNVSYMTQNDVATISIRFRKNDTHYMTLCNINPFMEIEIYSLSFHSDPRFETYNSSGFIYRENQKTLFLKSRHKSETETVRLTYGRRPVPVSVPKPEPVKSETADSEEEAVKSVVPVNTDDDDED